MHSADQLVAALWRRRPSWVVTFVVVLAGVAAVTYSLPKVYTTTSYLLVSTLNPTTSDFAAQQVSQVDTQTVAELLLTRNTANLVASQMPYASTGKALQGKVDVAPAAQTQLVLITAHESSPLRAQQLANTYANVFVQQSPSTVKSARVTVAEPAAQITNPSSPRPKLYLLIGVILAALAATGVSLLRDRLDQRLRIDDFATDLFGVPILARVPERRRGRAVTADINGRAAAGDLGFVEGFRLLFANLAFVSLDERPSTITVVSAREQEGKSTVCVAMAQAAAETEESVLVVDGDLRRPSLASRLDLAEAGMPGLSDYLAASGRRKGPTTLPVCDVPGTNLHLVPSGRLPPNPSSLLGRPSLEEFMQNAKALYDVVIYDTPPVSVGADASLIAARTEAAIVVVDAATSRRASVEWSLEQLRRAHVNVLGVIVNRVSGAGVAPYYYQGTDPGGGAGSAAPGERTETPAVSSRV